MEVSPSLRRPELLRGMAFVNGLWIDADSGASFPVVNPATGEVIRRVPDCREHDAIQAIRVTEGVFGEWRRLLPAERAVPLRRWNRLILENRQDLAAIMTAEQGKPLREALGEIEYAASYVEWFAEEALRVYGDVLPPVTRGQRLAVIRQPIGPVAAITPWNFPAAMVTRKAAPALAAGCTVLLKPAQQTPLSALALAKLAEEAGIPSGAFNVITSSHAQEIGRALTASPAIRKLSFTGSTEVGRALYAACAPTVKKLSLELGGNAPFIVFEDADTDLAAQGLMTAKFRNAGQTCNCPNRILVQRSVHDAFAAALAGRIAALKVGPGTERDTDIGPLIDRAAVEKIERLQRDALSKGASVMTGGSLAVPDSAFYRPTLLCGVNAAMDIFREEIFGPVTALIPFSTEEEAIAMANDSIYGLAAYIYTADHARMWRVAEALEYGMVGINESRTSHATIPFGGIKQSGIGREGSRYGIGEYLEMKYLCWGAS